MKRNETDILSKVQSWISFNNVLLASDTKHFYLQGDALDDLSKYIILNAEHRVVVSNPYVERCSLSDTLIETRKKEVNVLLLTRPIYSRDRYYREKQRYHESLKEANVMMAYHDSIHAKVIIVDECVAIVASLNFTSSSSSGRAWEAGMVSMDPDIVSSVSESLDGILQSGDTTIQNPVFDVRLEKYIERTPDIIFSYLTEPDLIPVWNSLIERVERASTLPLQVGSTQLLHLKNSTVTRESYLKYSEIEKFAVISVQNENIGAGQWELFPDSSGTLVRTIQGVVHKNPMSGSQYFIVKQVLDKYAEKTLDQLHQVILSHVD